MTNKGSGVPRVQPKTERVAEQLRQRETEKARELAEAEAARIQAAAEAAVQVDLATYMRQTAKEKMTFHLSSVVCDAIRDHARPLRMSHSEIVERGVRMFFRSQLVDLPGTSDG